MNKQSEECAKDAHEQMKRMLNKKYMKNRNRTKH